MVCHVLFGVRIEFAPSFLPEEVSLTSKATPTVGRAGEAPKE